MPVIRYVFDVEVDEEPTKSLLTRTIKVVKDYAIGTLVGVHLKGKVTFWKAHVHKSNEDHSCRVCVRMSQDDIA